MPIFLAWIILAAESLEGAVLVHGEGKLALLLGYKLCKIVMKFKHYKINLQLPQMSWSETLELENVTCETML